MMRPTMAVNPEQERRRLSDLYAHMTESELRQVADDAVDLTDIARQVLASEIAKRGLEIPLSDSVLPTAVESREMVTVRQFRDLPEALLAQGKLDSAGIESFLVDANMIRMNWFLSNSLGGVRLQVKKDDVEEALTLLSEPIPEGFEVEGLGTYQQPQCPYCGSFDISHEAGLDKRFALPALWVTGIPIPVPRNEWKCHSCRKEWRDSQSE